MEPRAQGLAQGGHAGLVARAIGGAPDDDRVGDGAVVEQAHARGLDVHGRLAEVVEEEHRGRVRVA